MYIKLKNQATTKELKQKMDKFLNYYIEKFKRLNRSLTAAGRAPHKPVLLLAIISWMARDPFCENDFEKKGLS